MKRDTARAILLAAALMTVQALLLAALASSNAQATTVYRCAAQDSGTVSYQSRACTSGAGDAINVADARNAAQQSQARQNHLQQMAWLDQHDSQGGARTTAKRRHRRKASSGPPQVGTPAAVPLTSHRIGERPFERLGQQVSPPSKVQKRKRNRYEITARTPAKARQTTSTAPNLKPSP